MQAKCDMVTGVKTDNSEIEKKSVEQKDCGHSGFHALPLLLLRFVTVPCSRLTKTNENPLWGSPSKMCYRTF